MRKEALESRSSVSTSLAWSPIVFITPFHLYSFASEVHWRSGTIILFLVCSIIEGISAAADDLMREMILHFLCDVDKGMEALLIDGRKIPSPGAIEGGRINLSPTRRCALHFRANRPCPKINTHSPFQRF